MEGETEWWIGLGFDGAVTETEAMVVDAHGSGTGSLCLSAQAAQSLQAPLDQVARLQTQLEKCTRLERRQGVCLVLQALLCKHCALDVYVYDS